MRRHLPPTLTRLTPAVLFCHALALAFTASCVKLPRRAAADAQIVPRAVREEIASPPDVTAHTRPLVNLNRATREELEKLPGIGEGLAARIVEHRERYGPFRRVEHLLAVRGISERRFAELRFYVTVD